MGTTDVASTDPPSELSPPRPDKLSLKTSYSDRFAMCTAAVNAAVSSDFPLRMCDLELHEEKALSIIKVMRRLQAEHPEHTFLFVIGTDLIPGLRMWYCGDELWDSCHFLILTRAGHAYTGLLPRFATVLSALPGLTLVNLEMSSTDIRERVRRWWEHVHTNSPEPRFCQAEGVLSAPVLEYILNKRLHEK
jgi:nicotinic acid mononucleotide adenylyltransferase